MKIRREPPGVRTLLVAAVTSFLLGLLAYCANWSGALLATLPLALTLLLLVFNLARDMRIWEKIAASVIAPIAVYASMYLNIVIVQGVAAYLKLSIPTEHFVRILPIYSFLYLGIAPAIAFALCLLLILEPLPSRLGRPPEN